MKKPGKRHGQLLLVLGTIVILTILATTVEWSKLAAAFLQVRPAPLVYAFVLTLFFPVLCTFRWLAVLRSQGVRLSYWRAFEVVMACQPVGNLTPGKAGDFLKATACHSKVVGLGSVLAERVVDVIILGLFGVTFGIAVGSWESVLGGCIGLGGGTAIILTARIAAKLLKGKPLAAKLEGFLTVFPGLARQPRLLAACALSSGLNWFLSMLQLWFLLEAFGTTASLPLIIAILPAATFAGLIPIPTFAGAGTRDTALLFLTKGIIDPASMLAASIIYTFFGYFLLGLAGLPFLGALTRGHVPEDDQPGGVR